MTVILIFGFRSRRNNSASLIADSRVEHVNARMCEESLTSV